MLGVGDREIGSDGGFPTATLAVNYQDAADPFHLRFFMMIETMIVQSDARRFLCSITNG